MTIQQLITNHLDIWTAADTAKKSGRGRSSGTAGSVYGIKKLRELILELAVRGKLVPQDESDEPASELLKRIAAEKARLVGRNSHRKTRGRWAVRSGDLFGESSDLQILYLHKDAASSRLVVLHVQGGNSCESRR